MKYSKIQFFAILVVAAATSSCWATDQLTNGGFETGDLMGWTDPSAAGNLDNAQIGAPAAGAQDGSFAIRLGLANGVSEASQSFPASPGDEFSFTGFLLTENMLPPGPTFGLLKIVFQDEFGADLEPESVSVGQFAPPENPGVESLPFLDAGSAVDTWICSKAQGVAPAGTTEVVFLLLNVDFSNGLENAMWFDNIDANDVSDGTNLLVNQSFETGDFDGWIPPVSGTPDNATIGAPTAGAQDGSFAVRLALANGVSELRQTFPANPGDEFNFSGFMLTENALPAGPTFGLYKIVFQDEFGADLEPDSISVGQFGPGDNPGIESLPFLDAGSTVNTWVFSEAQGVAPAGTTQVVFLALNVDFTGLENPMWFDNLDANNVADGVNLLENGSFETGDFSGWAAAPTGGNGTVGAPGVGAQAGSFAALLTNEAGVGELRQSAPAQPGDEFNLQGFMLSEAALPTGPSFGLYKIVFRDANGMDLEPESVSVGQFGPPENPGVESLAFLNDASMVNQWQFSEAQGVAPAGTVEVLFLALNVDFAGGSNPIWFDSVEATLIKEDCLLGDVNQDGFVTLLDVDPFVAIISANGFSCEADVDQNGVVDLLDVQPFVNILTGG